MELNTRTGRKNKLKSDHWGAMLVVLTENNTGQCLQRNQHFLKSTLAFVSLCLKRKKFSAKCIEIITAKLLCLLKHISPKSPKYIQVYNLEYVNKKHVFLSFYLAHKANIRYTL